MVSQQWSEFDAMRQAAPNPQGEILFDFITTTYLGPIWSLHICHLQLRLVFLGSTVNMLTPQQKLASGCTTVISETTMSKIHTSKRYYRQECNSTHK